MNLLISLRSEILKTKRTASFYLTIAAAAFGPLMTLLDIMIGEGIPASARNNFFNKLFIDKFQMTGLLALPIFLILICTLLPQIEYKNNTWKQVLTSPQSKWHIFLAKFINIQLLVFAFFIINLLFMFICALVVHFKNPSMNLLSQPLNGYDIAMLRINSYLVLLGLCAIHYWLGLRFKNFIISTGIGVALYFAGTVLVMQLQQSKIIYLPYTMFLYSGLPEFTPYVNGLNWYSLAYTLVFLAVGFVSFRKKRTIS
jgi:lantibiotic transport system permease protein